MCSQWNKILYPFMEYSKKIIISSDNRRILNTMQGK